MVLLRRAVLAAVIARRVLPGATAAAAAEVVGIVQRHGLSPKGGPRQSARPPLRLILVGEEAAVEFFRRLARVVGAERHAHALAQRPRRAAIGAGEEAIDGRLAAVRAREVARSHRVHAQLAHLRKREGSCGNRVGGVRRPAKTGSYPPWMDQEAWALPRRTDTDSRASQPRGVLRTAAGGRDPATARDRESNSATCNSPPLLVRPAQAQCHAYPVAVVWLKGDSVPPQAERG